jgi:hypothetical protein
MLEPLTQELKGAEFGRSIRLIAQLAGRRAKGLLEGAVECHEAVEAPREGDVRDGPLARRVHEGCAAFLEPTARHIML